MPRSRLSRATRHTDDDAALASAPLHVGRRRVAAREYTSVRNRLLSVYRDALALSSFLRACQPLHACEPPCTSRDAYLQAHACHIFANLRCGEWYAPPQRLPAQPRGVCYFKSVDGHSRKYCFPPSRLNLNVALAAAQHGRVYIVDSTRSGKALPDALTRTVVLWSCVLNAIVLGEVAPYPHMRVHASVSASERGRMCDFVTSCVATLHASVIACI